MLYCYLLLCALFIFMLGSCRHAFCLSSCLGHVCIEHFLISHWRTKFFPLNNRDKCVWMYRILHPEKVRQPWGGWPTQICHSLWGTPLSVWFKHCFLALALDAQGAPPPPLVWCSINPPQFFFFFAFIVSSPFVKSCSLLPWATIHSFTLQEFIILITECTTLWIAWPNIPCNTNLLSQFLHQVCSAPHCTAAHPVHGGLSCWPDCNNNSSVWCTVHCWIALTSW